MRPLNLRRPARSVRGARFIWDTTLTAGAQVSQAALAMLAGVLVARYGGPRVKGTLSVLIAIGSISILLGSLGIHLSAVYFIGSRKDVRRETISNTLLFAVVGGVATVFAVVIIAALLRTRVLGSITFPVFLVYALTIPFAYFNLFGRGILLGAGRIVAYNVPGLIEGVGLVAGTAVVLMAFGADVTPLVALRVVTEVSIAIFIMIRLRRAIASRLRFSRRLLGEQLRYGLKNYASAILWIFLLQSDIILCNHFLGSAPTGVYSVAVSLGQPVTLLAAVVGTLTFQRVSSDENRGSRIANTNTTLRILVILVAMLAIIVGIAAVWVIPIVYGKAFAPAVRALALLLPGLVALSLELVVINFLGGEGSPPIVFWAPLLGVLLNVGANLFTIPRWGIDGAAVTSSIAYGLVAAIVLCFYLRWTESRPRDLLFPRIADLRALRGAAPVRPEQESPSVA